MLWINIFIILFISDVISFSIQDIVNIFIYVKLDYSILNFIYYVFVTLSMTIFNFFFTVSEYYYYLNINFIYQNRSIIYGLKFCLSLLFLIFIRAGIPRYRYDFLTILGWNKFLFFCLFILIYILILYILQ